MRLGYVGLGSSGRCYSCRGSRFWRSVQGRTICWQCHPPAALQLVTETIDIGPPERSPPPPMLEEHEQAQTGTREHARIHNGDSHEDQRFVP